MQLNPRKLFFLVSAAFTPLVAFGTVALAMALSTVPVLLGPELKIDDHADMPAEAQAKGKPRKLSYKEQRELEALPERIAALEAEQTDIRNTLADGQIYSTDPQRAAQLHQRDAEIEDLLMQSLERWEALSATTS